jgi:hypothetical protein
MTLDVNRLTACLCLGIVLVAEAMQILSHEPSFEFFHHNSSATGSAPVPENVYICNLASASICAYVILMHVLFDSRVSRVDWMWFEHFCVEVPIIIMLCNNNNSFLASVITLFFIIFFSKLVHESALTREHEIFQIELENSNISIAKTTTEESTTLTPNAVENTEGSIVKLTRVDRVWPFSITLVSTLAVIVGVWYPIWNILETFPLMMKKIALVHLMFHLFTHFIHMFISVLPSRSSLRASSRLRGYLPYVHMILLTITTISSTYIIVID